MPATTLPIFTFDVGYDPVQLCLALADQPVCLLVRLHAGRCFYADPTAQPMTGRPRRHGAKVVCDDPTTWPTPSAAWMTSDARHGGVSLHERPAAWYPCSTWPSPGSRGPLHRQAMHHPKPKARQALTGSRKSPWAVGGFGWCRHVSLAGVYGPKLTPNPIAGRLAAHNNPHLTPLADSSCAWLRAKLRTTHVYWSSLV
jgi:DDE superfamily endonuclease